MTNHTENFMNRVTQALGRPIQTRCAELTVLFDKGSIKDTHSIFPIVIENIFGSQNSFSWELQSVNQAQNFQDFRALQHFLSPHGPMFRLIYTLLKDPQIKYEFGLSYLPTKVRQSLDTAVSHPFYAENLNINPHTKQVTSLVLNPFDYYFFHFAYYLINPWHQRLISSTISTFNSGSVYFNLCCDYIMHFLPTEPGCAVLPSINYYVGKNPIQTLPTFVRPVRISKLFRPNVLADAVNEINALSHSAEEHPRSHIWRSETVLIVFVDMWLNNDQVIQYEQIFLPNKQQFHFHDLPSAEYIRIVRVLVKKLHAFSSSAKIDDTYMNELKKIAVPYMQGKMYIFLRNLIYRWPLDDSFRLVLELWLSFIQPWRYPGNEQLELMGLTKQHDADGLSRPSKLADKEYLPFIVENILGSPTNNLKILICINHLKIGALSHELCVLFGICLKDSNKKKRPSNFGAHALNPPRLIVMGQPMLADMLREVESALENINNSPTHVRWPSSVPPLSPTSSWCSTNTSPNISFNKDHSHNLSYMGAASLSGSFIDSSVTYRGIGGKWSNIVKQKIVELECPNFCYKPLFTTQPAQEVFDLIRHIQKAQHAANAIIRLRKEEESKSSRG
ncbi:sphingomyelin phosphodiesterase 4-like, partial [Agrilus planipennis]|uniref:Sphingomyelin phosphodiesterase 4-like n=1 Tax=Agrilus planipennis TaxID=224129 RepID=A0A7F5QV44_AGRPL